jgi:PD-(D/E)XK nuclease superfamily protein
VNGDEMRDLLLQVDSYIEGLFTPPDPALEGTLRRSREAGLPEIQVSPEEGRLLQLLAEITGAKRIIDILIKSDSRAVLIENKIFAAADNPFDDYAAYLDLLRNENGATYENKSKNKILRTLCPSSGGKEWAFVNLTHADFASAVRSRLEHHVSEADTRYLTFY